MGSARLRDVVAHEGATVFKNYYYYYYYYYYRHYYYFLLLLIYVFIYVHFIEIFKSLLSNSVSS